MTEIRLSDVKEWNRGQRLFEDMQHLTNHKYEITQMLISGDNELSFKVEEYDEDIINDLFFRLPPIVCALKLHHGGAFSLEVHDESEFLCFEYNIPYSLEEDKSDFLDRLSVITSFESVQERDMFLIKKRMAIPHMDEQRHHAHGWGECGICFGEGLPIFKPNNGCSCSSLLCEDCILQLVKHEVVEETPESITVAINYRCPWCRRETTDLKTCS